MRKKRISRATKKEEEVMMKPMKTMTQPKRRVGVRKEKGQVKTLPSADSNSLLFREIDLFKARFFNEN